MSCMSGIKEGCDKRCIFKRKISLFFCKKHLKKSYRMELLQKIIPSIIKFQSIVKGYLIRRKLELHGFLIVNKKIKKETYHNTEDLFTCETLCKPLDCFLLRENNKIFWFHIKTMIEWVTKFDRKPTNPYTRQSFTLRDSLRIKRIIFRREKEDLFHEPQKIRQLGQYSSFYINMIVQYINETLSDSYIIESLNLINLQKYDIIQRFEKTYEKMKEFYTTTWEKNPSFSSYIDSFYDAIETMKKAELKNELLFWKAYLNNLAIIISIFSKQKDNYAFSFIIGKHLL